MNAGEGTTIIGKSVKITGDLSGSEDFTMDGEIVGTIQLPGARLTLGPTARVHGNVSAKDVVILGRMDGDIRATGRVELRASAIMQGNIYAATFSIEENATFRGQIDPSRAGEAMPDQPQPTLVQRQTGYSPADGQGSSLPRTGTQLPAALAAVAAARSTASEDSEATPSASLFAETKA